MEIREIKTFLNVARLCSFTKAAEKMNYTQSAVTLQIKNLEQELNTKLFNRVGKQVSMTSDGELFLHYALNITHQIMAAKEALTDNQSPLTGSFTIGSIDSLGTWILLALFEEYHRRYPLVNLSITIDSPETLLDQMNKNLLDFVYIADQKTNDPRWIKVFEKKEEVVFVTSSSKSLLRKSDLTLKELLRQPFLLTEKDASYRKLLEQYLSSVQLEVHPFLEAGNTELIIHFLQNNEGVSFLPYYTVKDHIQNGCLRILKVTDAPSIFIWRQLFYHKACISRVIHLSL